jgi:capsular polysaccharide biosynthesis protein
MGGTMLSVTGVTASQLALTGAPIAVSGPMRLRPAGTLHLAPPRELLVTRSIRAAFTPAGVVARDTLRSKGAADAPPSDRVPEHLPTGEVVLTVDEPVVWAGGLIGHYGHFLTESVARLWPLLPGGPLPGATVVFVPLNSGEPRFAAEWLGAFGIRVFSLPARGIVRFTEMHVPDPAWRTGAYAAPEMRAIHLHARRGLAVPHLPRVRLTYLSRTKITQGRKIEDEALLEREVVSRANVIHPEELSLAEQVAAFERSEVVAGIVGSALHTVLMAEHAPRCLYLTESRVTGGFVLQHRLTGGKGWFARCIDVTPPHCEEGPVRRVVVANALRALESVGLR